MRALKKSTTVHVCRADIIEGKATIKIERRLPATVSVIRDDWTGDERVKEEEFYRAQAQAIMDALWDYLPSGTTEHLAILMLEKFTSTGALARRTARTR